MSNQEVRSGSEYADLNPFFDAETSQALVLVGEPAIKYSISMLLTAHIKSRSRSFNVTWGSDIIDFLSEPQDEITAQKIQAAIVSAIDRHEPRVKVTPSQVKVTPIDTNNGYLVRIVYKLVSNDKVGSMSVMLGAM
jgi:phage baseplate assembly protein W